MVHPLYARRVGGIGYLGAMKQHGVSGKSLKQDNLSIAILALVRITTAMLSIQTYRRFRPEWPLHTSANNPTI
jgi:hypothetical protein